MFAAPVWADDFKDAQIALKAKNLDLAAEKFSRFAKKKYRDKRAGEALAKTARILDQLQDSFTEAFEKKCYWVKNAPKTPKCMRAGVQELNARFGKNAFEYIGGISIAYIQYTGSHYKQILKKKKRSDFKKEAEFYLLTHDMRGHPDVVVPKAKRYLDTQKDPVWKRKALLMWGRLNEDISYVWRKWTWVVYNGKISDEELIIRSEPYRLEARRAFKKIIAESPNSFEAKAARVDLQKLETRGDDGMLYFITNDSSPGTWQRWGVSIN